MLPPAQALFDQLLAAGRVRLFTDYDGTLAEFAPTPDVVEPEPELVALLSRLASLPALRVTVLSGRRLSHVETLVPVPNVLLAGTYGIEMRTREGQRVERVEYETVRPTLEQIKPRWAAAIDGRQGFYLEDKGWALALHARFASDAESAVVLGVAQEIAVGTIAGMPPYLFRILGGTKFLEIGPRLAHKGRSVEYLLERYPWPGAIPLFLGDDDKDEEAFGVVQAHHGISIVVAETWRPTRANFRLESPQAAREWLQELYEQFAAVPAAP
ncbi:MAG TPA: trehalose-phosphatase [Anaerolineae bacterium]|nr:trehalose-phosphatase [Anaerolineae bacterium]